MGVRGEAKTAILLRHKMMWRVGVAWFFVEEGGTGREEERDRQTRERENV